MKNKVKYGFMLMVLILSILSPVFAQNKKVVKGKYFGEKKPGLTPKVFGVELPWFKGKFVQDLAVSPDGKEICFVECSNLSDNWNGFIIYYTKQDKNRNWSEPVKAPFIGDLKGAFRPFFSPDGKRVAFIAQEPRDVWMSSREGNGWSKPFKMETPVNTEFIENTVSIADDNSLFICSHRDGGCNIYMAKEKSPGAYENPVHISDLNSGGNDCGAVMSPDGKYVIFHSTRPNGYGLADLYVSYKKDGGNWAKPINLGDKINTDQLEVIPQFSPDGKYLFFTRRRNFSTTEPSNIYWVSSKVINKAIKNSTKK